MVMKQVRGRERLQSFLNTMSEELTNALIDLPDGPKSFAVHRQLTRCRKRAELGDKRLRQIALENFESVNCRVGNLDIRLDPFIEHNAKLFISEAFERYNRRHDPSLIQIPYDYRHMYRLWKFGPGASNGVRGTHTAEKICQPMTCTAPARPLLQRLRKANVYFSAYDLRVGNDGLTEISGSRLTTVAKNEETERTIAIEPSGNMALQLGLGSYIAEVLKSIGLDISTQQDKNKLLAYAGSLSNALATIDMSSASDTFSLNLVRRLLPPGLYDTMLRLRSTETRLPGGKTVQLNMISTMGNGFTFPMMTLIFVALVYAVRLERGGPARYIDWTHTGVYGDDIIVPVHESERLIDVLTGCGFVVNTDKTYLSGPFRESCGGDYYLGRDVTPVYVKKLHRDSHIYVALNKVFEWCARQDVLLPRTITLLSSFLDGRVLFVPEWCGDDAGFRTTLVERRYAYLRVKQKFVRTIHPDFDMMLACGGYIVPRASDNFFTPRPFKTGYVVRRARIPRGYLDGRDPLTRSSHISAFIESYAFLVRQSGN